MNVAFNAKNPYMEYYSSERNEVRTQPVSRFSAKGNHKTSGGYAFQASSGDYSGYTYEKPKISEQLRTQLRELKQTERKKTNPFEAVSDDRAKGFPGLSGAQESDKDEKIEKPVNYNYKEVASKIQRAKTSLSAGQAVLSARRKVLELRRKISAGNGDAEDLQAALTHAKRMEMAARKKKHHLELEEMVVNTQRRDERQDEMEQAASDMKNALITAEEEKLTEKEDAIFEEREQMLSESIEQARETGREMSEEALAELNDMIADFGEEELKQLEEAMEMLENMEIVDPHMSKEDLEELKRKHRAAENKAIMKADMDYLKTTIKHQLEKAAGASGTGPAGVSGSLPGFSPGGAPDAMTAGVDVSLSGAAASGGGIDIQV
ncbi:MAG: hypothetical protein IJ796_08540 [Lachnospiraceae bacterium]|nr:hypothetical protein [Lachnospiraceae bacterium]